MNSITISPRFFYSELNAYANHREAVVREALQNSVDAGSSKIEFQYGEDWISIKDDGRGMNRDILINKFLSMGETTKMGDGTIGGFGRARLALCFAQESYQIISDDYRLEGIGGDYEIHDNEKTRGCFFKIQTKPTNWNRHILSVLSKSSLRQTVTINGEVYKSEISRGRWARSLSFGEVWVNKSQKQQILVRVGGVLMFSLDTNAPAQIIIEINPEISRDVLLSNRDSLKWEYQRELQSFVAELETESISALKTKKRSYFKPMKPGMAFLSRAKEKEIEYSTEKSESNGGNVITFTENEYGEEKIAAKTMESCTLSVANRIEEVIVRSCVPETSRFAEKWLESTVISVETEDVEICKVAKLYDPEIWKGGETRLKLLKIWKIAVDYCAECYTKLTGQSFYYSVGFVFSQECEAQCRKDGGIFSILLNPLGEGNKMKYSVTKRSDIGTLLVLAGHEISHLASFAHNEQFSHCFTNVMKEILKGEGEIWRKVREEK